MAIGIIILVVVLLLFIIGGIAVLVASSEESAPALPAQSAPAQSAASQPAASQPAAPRPVIPAAQPGAVRAGCTKCSDDIFWCPKSAHNTAHTDPILISKYRVPEYDPSTPNVILGGDGYYFRQGKAGC